MIQLNEYLINKSTKENTKKILEFNDFIDALKSNLYISETTNDSVAKSYTLNINENIDYPCLVISIYDKYKNCFHMSWVTVDYGKVQGIPEKFFDLLDSSGHEGFYKFNLYNIQLIKKILLEFSK